MHNNYIFSARDQKMRDRWLFWQIQLPGALFSLLVLIPILLSLYELTFLPEHLTLIGAATVIAILLYIPYYCAYKKSGTILLTLTLITIPLNIMYTIYHLGILKGSQSGEPILFQAIVNLVSTAWASWIFYLTYELRIINKNAHLRYIESSERFIEARSLFVTANIKDDLDEKYRDLVCKHESHADKDLIYEAYKRRKKTLA